MTTTHTERTGANTSTESLLWQKLKPLMTGAERIENTAKVGTPDVFYPTWHGWSWLELKLLYGRFVYLRKSQLAFLVRIMRLSPVHWPVYLVWDSKTEMAQLYKGDQMFNLVRRPYSEEKIQVEIDQDHLWLDLHSAIAALDVYKAS